MMRKMLRLSTVVTRTNKSLFKTNIRRYTSGAEELKAILSAKIPEKQAEIKELRQKYGNVSLGEVTVEQVYAGMRGIKGLVTETSLLDPQEGIRFRGYSIPECEELLPKAKDGKSPLPEGMLWLLLTGEIPTQQQVENLSRELYARSELPENVVNFMQNLDTNLHPMTQLSMGILSLQQYSEFAKAYRLGVHKKDYWHYAFEDSLTLIARVPKIAAMIYRNTFRKGEPSIIEADKNLDWGANYAKMMGVDKNRTNEVYELFRLYLTIHSDHEGGNASAHTTHLVGSTLADPYLSLSAGMNALAGPLHGLANQEVLRFIKQLKADLKGEKPTKENLTKLIWDVLNSGRVIPGYGHAVLRVTDPRYTCQRKFALEHMPNDELFGLLNILYEIIPGILTEHGKTKNPYPNVDAHSGVLLTHYGLVEEDYYTVMFGVSRSLGVLSSLVWDRALGLPIERPKSLTTDAIKKEIEARVKQQ